MLYGIGIVAFVGICCSWPWCPSICLGTALPWPPGPGRGGAPSPWPLAQRHLNPNAWAWMYGEGSLDPNWGQGQVWLDWTLQPSTQVTIEEVKRKGAGVWGAVCWNTEQIILDWEFSLCKVSLYTKINDATITQSGNLLGNGSGH